jgi:hypothetical protein
MSQFNGYYRDEEMSESVFKWIRTLESELSALKIAQESMGAEYRAMKGLEDAIRLYMDPGVVPCRTVLDALAELDRVRGIIRARMRPLREPEGELS